MTNITCDACGRPAEYIIGIAPLDSDDVVQRNDICRDCYDKIRKIITGMEVRDVNPV
jgi:hypothetical protein